MLPRTFRFAILLSLALALAAIGCNTVPLGDPEKSTSDAALAGWWESETPGNLVYIQLYDKHTYIVSYYSYEDNAGTIKARLKFTSKAWMTHVGDMDVMTCQILDPEWLAQGGPDADAKYSYFRVRKLPEGKLEATAMNSDFLKEAKTPEELTTKIADNEKNDELWKGQDPIVFKHSPDNRQEDVKKILSAFEPAK